MTPTITSVTAEYRDYRAGRIDSEEYVRRLFERGAEESEQRLAAVPRPVPRPTSRGHWAAARAAMTRKLR